MFKNWTKYIAGAILLITVVPLAAQEAQEDPVGIQVRAFGGLLPWGTHQTGSQIRRPTFGASVGIEGLYRLPIEGIDLDVGLGAKFVFNRSISVENSTFGYSVLPIYATVQLPLLFPESDQWFFYLAGRLGYAFFLTDQKYRDSIAGASDLVGGISYGIGLGLGFIPFDHFSITLELAYEGSGGLGSVVSDDRADISIGAGFAF